jgi:hypothetical protein
VVLNQTDLIIDILNKTTTLNERIIELIDIAPKNFGAQDTHLETIKKYYKT